MGLALSVPLAAGRGDALAAGASRDLPESAEYREGQYRLGKRRRLAKRLPPCLRGVAGIDFAGRTPR